MPHVVTVIGLAPHQTRVPQPPQCLCPPAFSHQSVQSRFIGHPEHQFCSAGVCPRHSMITASSTAEEPLLALSQLLRASHHHPWNPCVPAELSHHPWDPCVPAELTLCSHRGCCGAGAVPACSVSSVCCATYGCAGLPGDTMQGMAKPENAGGALQQSPCPLPPCTFLQPCITQLLGQEVNPWWDGQEIVKQVG